MTRELLIKHNHRMGFKHGWDNGHFTFADDMGKPHYNHELFGKSTTFPYYYNGFTRERNGHTYWLIEPVTIETRDVREIDCYKVWDDGDGPLTNEIHAKLHQDIPYMHKYARSIEGAYKAIDERVFIPINFLTNEEIESMGLHWWRGMENAGVVAVRDDSLAWDVFLGVKDSPSMPIPYRASSVKSWDDKIENYLYLTLPSQQSAKDKKEQLQEQESLKFYNISELPIPALKKVLINKGKLVSNEINLIKTINALVHNVEAIRKRQGY